MTQELAQTSLGGTTSRAEQRRQTEARILCAARKLFAESGYDRATIRAIATEAETDPGLVMRYFGSKESLFGKVMSAKAEEPIGGDLDQILERLLTLLSDRLTTDANGTLAMLRSMLTHPEAHKEVRHVFADRQRKIAAALNTEDAKLRAGLIGAVTVGTVVAYHMLEFDGLRDVEPETIVDILRPALRAIMTESDPK